MNTHSSEEFAGASAMPSEPDTKVDVKDTFGIDVDRPDLKREPWTPKSHPRFAGVDPDDLRAAARTYAEAPAVAEEAEHMPLQQVIAALKPLLDDQDENVQAATQEALDKLQG